MFRALPVDTRKGSRQPFGLLPTILKRIMMSAKLYVGNLSNETTSEELQNLFSAVGVVQSCQLIIDRGTGLSKGFAFVEMNSAETARAAKEKFNGQDLHGKSLKVDDARPRP
ncbi:MAG TPA: RNA-binding protein [Blastocatellia bacterium]|nr:RNA-binding protein [Blastocatellia bacterium]